MTIKLSPHVSRNRLLASLVVFWIASWCCIAFCDELLAAPGNCTNVCQLKEKFWSGPNPGVTWGEFSESTCIICTNAVDGQTKGSCLLSEFTFNTPCTESSYPQKVRTYDDGSILCDSVPVGNTVWIEATLSGLANTDWIPLTSKVFLCQLQNSP
jgi:hypothetical protein